MWLWKRKCNHVRSHKTGASGSPLSHNLRLVQHSSLNNHFGFFSFPGNNYSSLWILEIICWGEEVAWNGVCHVIIH